VRQLIDPAVGAGRRFVFVFVDVDVEFFAIPLVFPIRHFVAQAEKIRVAAQIQIADEHAAQVADVTDFVVAQAKGAEEGDGRHAGYDPFHFYGNRNRDDVGATVGKEDGAGDENSENSARSADGGRKRVLTPPKHGNGFNYDVENASADAGKKIVAKKAVAAPDQFHFAAKHPQREHIYNDVPNAVDIVQEKIRKWLPDSQQWNDSRRDQSEPFEEPVVAADAAEIMDKGFEDVHGDIGDDQQLHTRSDIKIKTDAVGAYAGAGSHGFFSLRSESGGSKDGRP
jgi:hypothetical protein